jgi:hypothetical protein
LSILVKLSDGEEVKINSAEETTALVAQITSSRPFYEVLIEGQAPLYLNPEHVVSIRESVEDKKK